MAESYPKLSATLKKLLFHKDMKSAELARALDISPPTIHRLVTGKTTRPYQSSIEPIAEFFGVTAEQLLGIEPLTIDEESKKRKTSLELEALRAIPLISWDSLEQKREHWRINTYLAAGNISEQSYALIMEDYSMEPVFNKGSIIIFDPLIKPLDRSYVLVKIASNTTYVLRQLLIDVDNQFIKSLNPDISASSMRLLSGDDKIIATLVESRNNFVNQEKNQ